MVKPINIPRPVVLALRGVELISGGVSIPVRQTVFALTFPRLLRVSSVTTSILSLKITRGPPTALYSRKLWRLSQSSSASFGSFPNWYIEFLGGRTFFCLSAGGLLSGSSSLGSTVGTYFPCERTVSARVGELFKVSASSAQVPGSSLDSLELISSSRGGGAVGKGFTRRPILRDWMNDYGKVEMWAVYRVTNHHYGVLGGAFIDLCLDWHSIFYILYPLRMKLGCFNAKLVVWPWLSNLVNLLQKSDFSLSLPFNKRKLNHPEIFDSPSTGTNMFEELY